MSAVVAVAVVSLVMTLRAIEPSRWSYWWSFSRRWALVGGAATIAVLAVVSTIGVVAGRQGAHTDIPEWIRDTTTALAAQSALRRLRVKERGGTLALGVLPDVFTWVDHFVRQQVVSWAEGLSDDGLIRAASGTDDKLKGIRRPGTLEQRVAWREQKVQRLSQAGAVRDESRNELISLIERGYSTYLLRKRS